MRVLAPYKTAIAHVLGRIPWLGTPLQHHALHGGHSPQLQRRAPRTWTQAATYASSSVKKTIVYKCTTCGETATQWKGRCPSCAGWNTCGAFSDHGLDLVSWESVGACVESMQKCTNAQPCTSACILPYARCLEVTDRARMLPNLTGWRRRRCTRRRPR